MSAASSVPIRCFSRNGPWNACLNGHLLVDREPDQERERIGRDELVRLVRVGEVERLGHASSVDLGGTLEKWTRSTSSRPETRTWFERAFAEPTPAQALGWPAIAKGGNVLIQAPTGSGKTLAAFLIGIDRLNASPG